jgi:hypothetical protein
MLSGANSLSTCALTEVPEERGGLRVLLVFPPCAFLGHLGFRECARFFAALRQRLGGFFAAACTECFADLTADPCATGAHTATATIKVMSARTKRRRCAEGSTKAPYEAST